MSETPTTSHSDETMRKIQKILKISELLSMENIFQLFKKNNFVFRTQMKTEISKLLAGVLGFKNSQEYRNKFAQIGNMRGICGNNHPN